jgi:hypothetical protein
MSPTHSPGAKGKEKESGIDQLPPPVIPRHVTGSSDSLNRSIRSARSSPLAISLPPSPSSTSRPQTLGPKTGASRSTSPLRQNSQTDEMGVIESGTSGPEARSSTSSVNGKGKKSSLSPSNWLGSSARSNASTEKDSTPTEGTAKWSMKRLSKGIF